MVWTIWSLMPQWPMETVRDIEANYWNRDCGPKVDFGFRYLSQPDFDTASRSFEETDPTWTIKYLDNGRLSVVQRGSETTLGTLPAADYRWPQGSRFGHRLRVYVADEGQIWDVKHGKLLYRGFISPSGSLTVSGRHLEIVEVTEFYGTDLKVVDVESGQQIVHVRTEMKVEPWHQGGDTPVLDRFRWSAFSADGKLLALEIRDKSGKCWIWRWSLEERRPTALIPLSVSSFDVSIQGEPMFGTSHRYLANTNERQSLLFDLGTDPPTDLSYLISDFPIDYFNDRIFLTRNRAIAKNKDDTECRVWDLDKRCVIARHDMAGHIALSPDDRFALLWTSNQPNKLQFFIQKLQQYFGFSLYFGRDHYHVIDLETGQITNHIVSDHLHHFDWQTESVWSAETTGNNPNDPVIFRRYPLRASGPPWWLWLLTGVGGLAMIREGRSWRPNRRATLATIKIC
jgi:hypothetical protein